MDALDTALLAASPLFAGIDVRELDAALAALPHRIQVLPAGSVALLAGCVYDDLRILLEGELSAEMTGDDGRTVVVEVLRAPDAVATAVLFAPEKILPVTAIAKSPTRFVIIPRSSLLALCARFRPLLEALLADMGSRVAFLAERLRAVQFATLRERLADWLLRRADFSPRPPGDAPRSILLEASKERLASLFGVARPSLSRELGELSRRGLIRVEGRKITILDEKGLRRLKAR